MLKVNDSKGRHTSIAPRTKVLGAYFLSVTYSRLSKKILGAWGEVRSNNLFCKDLH